MRRRDFIAGLVGGAAGFPALAGAQLADRVRRIGALAASVATDSDAQADFGAFIAGLLSRRWIIGENCVVDHRCPGSDVARLNADARDLMRSAPDVLLTTGIASTAAAMKLTQTIPIVFTRVSNPLGEGFVKSLARPGGNVTGFSNFEPAFGPKWVQTLKEIVPGLTRAAVMANPRTSAFEAYFRVIAASSKPLGIEPLAAPVQSPDEIESALADAASKSGSGLIVLPDGFMVAHRAGVLAGAVKHSLPAIYPFRSFTSEGGLASYGIDTKEQYRQAALYVDRILKGEGAGDLPVQAPTKFELVINLKIAKAIGITIPESQLHLADEVIE